VTEFERAALVSRLTSGVTPLKVGGVRLYAGRPSPEHRTIAFEVRDEAYRRACFEGAWTAEAARTHLVDVLKAWSDDLDEREKTLAAHEDDLLAELYKSLAEPAKTGGLRRGLLAIRDELAGLRARRTLLDAHTAETAARLAMVRFLTGCSLRHADGTPYWPDPDAGWEEPDVLLEAAMTRLAELQPTQGQIREVARSPEWGQVWSLRDAAAGLVDVPASELIDDPLAPLLLWTSLYQEASRRQDGPPRAAIEDDDLFDGWLVIERRGREMEDDPTARLYRNIIGRNPRMNGAQEVFVLMDTAREKGYAAEAASLIDRYTDEEARRIKAERAAYLRSDEARRLREEHGGINDVCLPDVKRRLQAEFLSQNKR